MSKKSQKENQQIKQHKQKQEDDFFEKVIQNEENLYRVSKKPKQNNEIQEQIHIIQDIPQNPNAAWQDDEEIEVDLTQIARLKKLRKNDEETIVSGQEYEERLQDFYKNKLFKNEFFKWGQDRSHQEFAEPESEFNLQNLINTDYQYFENKQTMEFQPGILNINKIGRTMLKDKHNAVVQKIDFYQNSGVFLSCGMDKMLKIFSINEEEKFQKNQINLIKKVYTDDMPLTNAQFLNYSNQVLLCGQRKHLLSYDLVQDKIQKISSNFFTQRFKKQIDKQFCLKSFSISQKETYLALWDHQGFVYILSGKSKQFLFEFKINSGMVLSASFSPDEKYVFLSSNKGKIFQYDLQSRKILNAFQDPGSFNSAYLSASSKYLISASSSSYLNIFSEGKLLKSLDNLTTPLTGCEFSQNQQFVTFYSDKKPNSIRIVSFPDVQVVKNWPNLQTKIGFITTSAWGMQGSRLALGNKSGDIEVYKIGN